MNEEDIFTGGPLVVAEEPMPQSGREKRESLLAYEAGLEVGRRPESRTVPQFAFRHKEWFTAGIEDAKRQPGYYWLKTEAGPIVGEWTGKDWLFTGDFVSTSGMFYREKDIIGQVVAPEGV
jgi:hypothetical protein